VTAAAAYNEGRFSEAIRLYSLVLKQGTDQSAALCGRGMAYEMINQPAKAEEDYRSAIEKDSGNYRAMENLAGVWERSGKHIAEAAELYRRALALDPRPEWKENLRAWIGILESHLNSEISSPVACLHRGNAKADQGDHQAAEALYSRAIALNPRLFQAYYNRGMLRSKVSNLSGALEDFDEAIRIAPKVRGYLIQRGLIYERMGDMQRARQDFERAVAVDPRDPNAFFHAARAREQDGEYEGALQLYRTAMNLRPKPELSRLLNERVAAVSVNVKPDQNRKQPQPAPSKELW
jgi:tetratricopeptide (TPR) repeat protein